MDKFPDDIYTEPSAIDTDTLSQLGPLAAMAGIWEGTGGVDINPKADGPDTQTFSERIELQPIDPQTNGPQLLYGLRYHTRIVKPGEIATYHDQIGYWLWEPATGTLIQTVSIPRGQTVMAVGQARADARAFELRAERGAPCFGILSAPFLEHAFRTDAYSIRVQLHADGAWSYDEDTVLMIRGQEAPFHHRDRNRLTRIAAPTPNPLAPRR